MRALSALAERMVCVLQKLRMTPSRVLGEKPPHTSRERAATMTDVYVRHRGLVLITIGPIARSERCVVKSLKTAADPAARPGSWRASGRARELLIPTVQCECEQRSRRDGGEWNQGPRGTIFYHSHSHFARLEESSTWESTSPMSRSVISTTYSELSLQALGDLRELQPDNEELEDEIRRRIQIKEEEIKRKEQDADAEEYESYKGPSTAYLRYNQAMQGSWAIDIYNTLKPTLWWTATTIMILLYSVDTLRHKVYSVVGLLIVIYAGKKVAIRLAAEKKEA